LRADACAAAASFGFWGHFVEPMDQSGSQNVFLVWSPILSQSPPCAYTGIESQLIASADDMINNAIFIMD